jgi:predicted methyltransferase
MFAIAATALALTGAPACAHENHAGHAEVRVDALDAAIADPGRTPANVARDSWRHPKETLAFFGLAPGMRVIEIAPGGGWYSEILAPYAKATGGRYVATAADLADPATSDRAKQGRETFTARFASGNYGAVEVVNFGPRSGPLGPPNSADLVLTFRNVHNFLAQGTLDKVLSDAFAVLKPGGVLGVVEHRAKPGPQDPKAASGYVTEAFMIEAAGKAGFELSARSDINANPKDDTDHPFGVWTLPPVRRSPPADKPDPTFDRAAFDAIGESDRMTLKFVKPLR